MRGYDGRIVSHAANNLRNVVCQKLRIAGIDSLRREREQEIFVELQSLLFKHREQHFVSRARVSGRLENDQHATTQVLRDLFGGSEDIGDVGLFRFPKRRRDADDDGVALAKMTEVCCGSQSL